MENRRRSIESINGEFQLPEAIIQHIQSFLTGKEAAQTSILSKSWYSAWSTHPDVEFDQRYFAGPRAVDGFPEFTRTVLQRYENLNRKVNSLKLWMYSKPKHGYNPVLASELVVKVMKLGATDLHVEFPKLLSFILPPEVLRSEALTNLSVIGCTIDQCVVEKVNCLRLKSLSLDNVLMGDIIWVIISNCPLIENLTLTRCVHLTENQLNVGVLTLSPPAFHKLKYLFLGIVELNSMFFSYFSSKFPCLEDLTIHECTGYEQIHILSNSLERISFVVKSRDVLRAKFDVPSIRKFSFSGTYVPALSFGTTSKEWESDVSFLDGEPGVLSVPKLKWLFEKLSQSKITLSLNIVLLSDKNFEYVGDVGDLPRPVVENLTLMMTNAPSSVCSALLDCLFWSCCPKFITQFLLPESLIDENFSLNVVEILCKRLIQFNQDSYVVNRSMFGQCDLEEVNVERLEEDLDVWSPLPWKALLGASKGPENKQKVRFVLRWGQ